MSTAAVVPIPAASPSACARLGLPLLGVLVLALAVPHPADAATAAVDAAAVQVGLSDYGRLGHNGPTNNPPPSCNSLGPLTVRAVAGGGLGECEVIPFSTDYWGVSYQEPGVGFIAAPCVDYGGAPMPCDPYEVPGSKVARIAFTCAPACSSDVASATAATNVDPGGGRPRGKLVVEHTIRDSAHPSLARIDITVRNPTSDTLTDVRYRRVDAATELYAPGSGASTSYGAAEGTYTRVWLGGQYPDPPAALECSSTAAWAAAAPQVEDCLATAPPSARSALNHCHDTGAPAAAPLPGPGTVTMPPMGTWASGVVGHLACAHGSLWQFRLGDLPPGASKTFRMYVGGILGGEPAARDALTTGLGTEAAEMWTIAEPGTMSVDVWPTLMIGWRGFYEPLPAFEWTTPQPEWAHLLPAPYQPGVTVCLGEAADFTGSLVTGSWPVVASTWDWGDGATTTVTPGPGAPSHTYGTTGTHEVTLTVLDDHGFSGVARSTLLVMECPEPVTPNVCPAIEPLQGAVLFPGEVLRLRLATSDADRDWRGQPTPDPLHVALVVTPESATVRFDPGTGELVWSPAESEGGQYVLEFRVSDEACLTTLSIPVKVIARLPLAVDRDQDGTADEQDNCPSVPNRDQADWDRDGEGDACGDRPPAASLPPAPIKERVAPGDFDGDLVPDASDVCIDIPDAAQADLDGDRVGDACDPDRDGDGIVQWGQEVHLDVCPDVPDPSQADADGDLVGDACSAVHVAHGAPAEPADAPSPRDTPVPLLLAVAALVLALRRRRAHSG